MHESHHGYWSILIKEKEMKDVNQDKVNLQRLAAEKESAIARHREAALDYNIKSRTPQEGATAYRVDCCGGVHEFVWTGSEQDAARLAQGNVYRSERGAKRKARWNRIHAFLMQNSDGWDGRENNIDPAWYRVFKPNTAYFYGSDRMNKAIALLEKADFDFYLEYDGGICD